MRRTALVVAVVGAAAVVGSVPALAVLGSVPAAGGLAVPWSGEVVPAPARDLPDQPATQQALERAERAARMVSYTGVAAVQEWGAEGGVSRVVDVERIAGTATRVRVRGSMDDPVLTSDRGVPSVAPGDAGRMLGLLADSYAVSFAAVDRVAGRSAQVVQAHRADGGLAARVWLDRRSGLVLRREVYDAVGHTVQSASFLSLRVLGRTFAGSDDVVPEWGSGPTAVAAQAWAEQVDTDVLPAWRERGWACPEALPERLTLVDVRRAEAEGGDVLQLVYSDGLVTVSLFEQRGRLEPGALEGFRAADVAGVQAWTRPGAPAQVVWQSGDSVLTLVADAPSDVVAAVVAALPGAPATPDGLVDRVARGWSRVVDAATPW